MLSSILWYIDFAILLPCHSSLMVMPGYGLSFLTRMSISPPVSILILNNPTPSPAAIS